MGAITTQNVAYRPTVNFCVRVGTDMTLQKPIGHYVAEIIYAANLQRQLYGKAKHAEYVDDDADLSDPINVENHPAPWVIDSDEDVWYKPETFGTGHTELNGLYALVTTTIQDVIDTWEESNLGAFSLWGVSKDTNGHGAFHNSEIDILSRHDDTLNQYIPKLCCIFVAANRLKIYDIMGPALAASDSTSVSDENLVCDFYLRDDSRNIVSGAILACGSPTGTIYVVFSDRKVRAYDNDGRGGTLVTTLDHLPNSIIAKSPGFWYTSGGVLYAQNTSGSSQYVFTTYAHAAGATSFTSYQTDPSVPDVQTVDAVIDVDLLFTGERPPPSGDYWEVYIVQGNKVVRGQFNINTERGMLMEDFDFNTAMSGAAPSLYPIACFPQPDSDEYSLILPGGGRKGVQNLPWGISKWLVTRELLEHKTTSENVIHWYLSNSVSLTGSASHRYPSGLSHSSPWNNYWIIEREYRAIFSLNIAAMANFDAGKASLDIYCQGYPDSGPTLPSRDMSIHAYTGDPPGYGGDYEAFFGAVGAQLFTWNTPALLANWATGLYGPGFHFSRLNKWSNVDVSAGGTLWLIMKSDTPYNWNTGGGAIFQMFPFINFDWTA